ncbi:MAG TPA: tryptophan synthase subunit alpha [Cyclobacteriaceae bacterium]|jgi:tryptophan synthase alpha chain|nr:tryptophan synthase subunit alpha [Cyclobacteriaceae bacterium]
MNRIDELFKRKKQNILSVFFTAGFPKLNDTVLVAKELESAGADMIEIGIPFSDPVADGPVIQESNKTALDNGMNVRLLLQQVTEIRKDVKLPIILMGYLNPVVQYGVEEFCTDAAKAGVDGVILPDLPLTEFENEYRHFFEKKNLRAIFLISPTTAESRIRDIDHASSGFVYAVSSSSTTGAKGEFSNEQIGYFEKLRLLKLKNPWLIGFGISNAAAFDVACRFASGAIVGSAFIQMLKASKNLGDGIHKFVKDIKG